MPVAAANVQSAPPVVSAVEARFSIPSDKDTVQDSRGNYHQPQPVRSAEPVPPNAHPDRRHTAPHPNENSPRLQHLRSLITGLGKGRKSADAPGVLWPRRKKRKNTESARAAENDSATGCQSPYSFSGSLTKAAATHATSSNIPQVPQLTPPRTAAAVQERPTASSRAPSPTKVLSTSVEDVGFQIPYATQRRGGSADYHGKLKHEATTSSLPPPNAAPLMRQHASPRAACAVAECGQLRTNALSTQHGTASEPQKDRYVSASTAASHFKAAAPMAQHTLPVDAPRSSSNITAQMPIRSPAASVALRSAVPQSPKNTKVLHTSYPTAQMPLSPPTRPLSDSSSSPASPFTFLRTQRSGSPSHDIVSDFPSSPLHSAHHGASAGRKGPSVAAGEERKEGKGVNWVVEQRPRIEAGTEWKGAHRETERSRSVEETLRATDAITLKSAHEVAMYKKCIVAVDEIHKLRTVIREGNQCIGQVCLTVARLIEDEAIEKSLTPASKPRSIQGEFHTEPVTLVARDVSLASSRCPTPSSSPAPIFPDSDARGPRVPAAFGTAESLGSPCLLPQQVSSPRNAVDSVPRVGGSPRPDSNKSGEKNDWVDKDWWTHDHNNNRTWGNNWGAGNDQGNWRQKSWFPPQSARTDSSWREYGYADSRQQKWTWSWGWPRDNTKDSGGNEDFRWNQSWWKNGDDKCDHSTTNHHTSRERRRIQERDAAEIPKGDASHARTQPERRRMYHECGLSLHGRVKCYGSDRSRKDDYESTTSSSESRHQYGSLTTSGKIRARSPGSDGFYSDPDDSMWTEYDTWTPRIRSHPVTRGKRESHLQKEVLDRGVETVSPAYEEYQKRYGTNDGFLPGARNEGNSRAARSDMEPTVHSGGRRAHAKEEPRSIGWSGMRSKTGSYIDESGDHTLQFERDPLKPQRSTSRERSRPDSTEDEWKARKQRTRGSWSRENVNEDITLVLDSNHEEKYCPVPHISSLPLQHTQDEVYKRKNAESSAIVPGMASSDLRQRARKAALKVDYGGGDAARRRQAAALQHAWGGSGTDFTVLGEAGLRDVMAGQNVPDESFYSTNDLARTGDIKLGATSEDKKRSSAFLDNCFRR